MSSEHVEVLERLRGVLEHGKMGDKCLIAPDLVEKVIASLSAQQSGDAESKLAEAGVFAGHHGLRGLADADEFWEAQPYGTRLYYGDGGMDYLHRGVLKTAVEILDAAPQPPARMVGCEGDDGLIRTHPEAETCDVCAPKPEPAEAQEVMCLECGQPTMPMGQVCYACSHPAEKPAEAQAQGGGEVVAWRVPVLQSPFGEWLDHGVRDGLVLVMHRGTHGWKAAGQGHALLAHQIYVKNVEPLCATSHEVAVVGLSGGGWRTVWARSDDDVTHPAPPSPPAGAEVASLPALWRLREDNGEEHSEYDKGFETASDECARMLEDALAQQPAAVDEGARLDAERMDAIKRLRLAVTPVEGGGWDVSVFGAEDCKETLLGSGADVRSAIDEAVTLAAQQGGES